MPPKVRKAKAKFRLGTRGRKLWRDLSQQLEATGILTTLDLHALSRLCYLVQEWETLLAYIEEHGRSYEIYFEQTEQEIKAGSAQRLKKICQRPEVILMNQLGKEINRLEQQFGLTPSTRASFGITHALPGVKKDETDDKLFG